MVNVILKDETGTDVTYKGVTDVRLHTTDGGVVNFTEGEKTNATVDLDFSNGDMNVTSPTGSVYSKISIPKPITLTPENIATGVNVCGIVGTLEASSGEDEETIVDVLISGHLTALQSNATTVKRYTFYGSGFLKTIDLPMATEINDYSFYNSGLSSINCPLVTWIGNYAFASCKWLTEVVFPSTANITANAFRNCSELAKADFHSASSIINGAFYSCSALTSLIIRSSSVCTLNNTGVLTNTPIASGTGYIYVPSALIDTYKSATNWATYSAQFRALEDYTVDGTTTGELDDTKI